jgi:chemotaxis protein MotB
MAENIQSPIVVKKIKKVAGGHHGGAWKIAYADFVTAMMAFFLLMWLLGSESSGTLSGIAEYFKNPVKVSMQSGSGSGGSNSILPGGGRTITKKDGQESPAQVNPTVKTVTNNKTSDPKNTSSSKNTIDPSVLEKQKKDSAEYENLKKTEAESLNALEQQLRKMIESDPNLRPFKDQIMLDINTDGLRIQIVDKQNRPMFGLAKAELEPFAKNILKAMGPLINSVPNKIKIAGHTDSLPFNPANKSYGNWELSAERANAARRELVNNGQMNPDKVLQIDGMGSAVPFDKDNLLNPVNRRIAIVVMNIKAEARVREDQKMLEIIEAAEAETLLRNLEEQKKNEDELPSTDTQENDIPPDTTSAPADTETDNLLLNPEIQQNNVNEIPPPVQPIDTPGVEPLPSNNVENTDIQTPDNSTGKEDNVLQNSTTTTPLIESPQSSP